MRLASRLFDPRTKSLVRGTALVVGSLALAVWWSGFPEIRASLRLVLPTVLAMCGTADTARCLQLRWGFYHGGVLLLLYADIMALSMILFLLLYPYFGGMV